MYRPATRLILFMMVGSIVVIDHAHASGFAIPSQNGAGAGYAYAGTAAVVQDASTIFFNPAGMTYLAPGHHIVSVLGIPVNSLRFKDAGSVAFQNSPLDDGG